MSLFAYLLTSSELAKMVFSYSHKSLRSGDSYIIYKDSSFCAIEEDKFKDNGEIIGIIENGLFLPYCENI